MYFIIEHFPVSRMTPILTSKFFFKKIQNKIKAKVTFGLFRKFEIFLYIKKIKHLWYREMWIFLFLSSRHDYNIFLENNFIFYFFPSKCCSNLCTCVYFFLTGTFFMLNIFLFESEVLTWLTTKKSKNICFTIHPPPTPPTLDIFSLYLPLL